MCSSSHSISCSQCSAQTHSITISLFLSVRKMCYVARCITHRSHTCISYNTLCVPIYIPFFFFFVVFFSLFLGEKRLFFAFASCKFHYSILLFAFFRLEIIISFRSKEPLKINSKIQLKSFCWCVSLSFFSSLFLWSCFFFFFF